jgi:hypothetical protein
MRWKSLCKCRENLCKCRTSPPFPLALREWASCPQFKYMSLLSVPEKSGTYFSMRRYLAVQELNLLRNCTGRYSYPQSDIPYRRPPLGYFACLKLDIFLNVIFPGVILIFNFLSFEGVPRAAAISVGKNSAGHRILQNVVILYCPYDEA